MRPKAAISESRSKLSPARAARKRRSPARSGDWTSALNRVSRSEEVSVLDTAPDSGDSPQIPSLVGDSPHPSSYIGACPILRQIPRVGDCPPYRYRYQYPSAGSSAAGRGLVVIRLELLDEPLHLDRIRLPVALAVDGA